MAIDSNKVKEGLRGGIPRDKMLEEEAKIKEGLRGGTPRPGAQPTPTVPPPAPSAPTPIPTPPSAPTVPPAAPPVTGGAAVKAGIGAGKVLLIAGGLVAVAVVVGAVMFWDMLKEKTGIRDIDLRDDGVTIETDQGTLESSDKLPSDFPRDFPIYTDVEVFFSLKIQEDKFSVEWIANGSLLEVVEFYREKLPEYDWEIVNEVRSENGSQFIFSHNEQDRGGVVTVNKRSNGDVRVQVVVN